MPAPYWPGIRPGAIPISVYNESLLVFLWDEAHRAVVELSKADFEGGYSYDDAEIDKPLKRLAKDGILIAYELAQDDAVAAEVVVGPLLTKAELNRARWHRPRTAKLNLPSGVLRIDTRNTFPVDSDPDDDEQPGRVSVPPGQYVLTLYRLDWGRLLEDGLLGEAEQWTGPHEVIVLTPTAESKPVRGANPLLRLPESDTSIWKGKYTIDSGVFRGKAIAHEPQQMCFVNLDRPAVEQLGLAPGMLFRLEVMGLLLEVVFMGEGDPAEMGTSWVKSGSAGRTEFGAAYRPTHDPASLHTLVVWREVAAADFPVLRKWIAATVTVLAERFALPARPPIAVGVDELENLDDLIDLSELE